MKRALCLSISSLMLCAQAATNLISKPWAEYPLSTNVSTNDDLYGARWSGTNWYVQRSKVKDVGDKIMGAATVVIPNTLSVSNANVARLNVGALIASNALFFPSQVQTNDTNVIVITNFHAAPELVGIYDIQIPNIWTLTNSEGAIIGTIDHWRDSAYYDLRNEAIDVVASCLVADFPGGLSGHWGVTNAASGSAVTVSGAVVITNGPLTVSSNVIATRFVGDGRAVTNVQWANVSGRTVALTNGQANVVLSSLSVSNDLTIRSGGLVVSNASGATVILTNGTITASNAVITSLTVTNLSVASLTVGSKTITNLSEVASTNMAVLTMGNDIGLDTSVIWVTNWPGNTNFVGPYYQQLTNRWTRVVPGVIDATIEVSGNMCSMITNGVYTVSYVSSSNFPAGLNGQYRTITNQSLNTFLVKNAVITNLTVSNLTANSLTVSNANSTYYDQYGIPRYLSISENATYVGQAWYYTPTQYLGTIQVTLNVSSVHDSTWKVCMFAVKDGVTNASATNFWAGWTSTNDGWGIISGTSPAFAPEKSKLWCPLSPSTNAFTTGTKILSAKIPAGSYSLVLWDIYWGYPPNKLGEPLIIPKGSPVRYTVVPGQTNFVSATVMHTDPGAPADNDWHTYMVW